MPRSYTTTWTSIDCRPRIAALGWAGAACLCLVFFSSSAARAQVMEIGADGSVAVRSGPAVYLTPDLKPDPIRPLAQPGFSPRPTHPNSSVKDAIDGASASYRISPALVSAIAWQESGFDANAVSPKGARGVMQLMPKTARMLNVDPGAVTQNVDGGVAYLSILLNHFHGDVIRTLAAYNAGPDAVDRYGGIPPYRETRSYVDAILDRMSAMAIAE
jgi:hypothetical protein